MSLAEIQAELERRPIAVNKFRPSSGLGRSQAFGVVGRRCMPPDYSRLCWQRPYLYKLLLEYGAANVPCPFTSITVNMNYQATAHRDRNNIGVSFLVGCGTYAGGELEILEGEMKGKYDIRTPVITDFSKVLHAVLPFTGTRYSLVYYTANRSEGLPPPSTELIDGKWVFKRGDEVCRGLPHPLKGRTRV